MKKSLLLLGTLMLSSLSGMAQSFTANWPKAEAPAATEFVAETECYLYNVGAGGFYTSHAGSTGSPYWGTRASVNDTIGARVIFTRTNPGDGVEETWDEAEENTYLLTSYVPKFSEYRCTFAGGTNEQPVVDDIWTDNNTRGDRYFNITKVGNYYKIDRNTVLMQGSSFVGKSYEGKYLGVLGSNLDRVLYLHDTDVYVDEGDNEYYLIDPSEEFFEDWIIVAPDEYDAWMASANPTIGKTYLAALKLRTALEKAYEENPGINLNDILAVYNNTSSTFDQLVIAQGQIQEVVNNYKASFASFDDPIDFSESIGSTTSSFDPWVRDFTGTGTVGDTAWNTWSVEANNNGDGTDMVTPFRQVWVASGSILSDQKIHQTLAGAAPGLYQFTVDARVYSEAGKLDAFEGCYLYFGDEKVDMQEQVAIYYSGSKSVLWSKNYFTIIAIVKEGGDIDFGFEIKNANFNWISWKNVSLKYYGNEDVEANALKLLKDAYTFEKVNEEDYDANPSVIEAYNKAVDDYDAASSEEGIKTAAAAADAAQTALTENVAAHETFYQKIDIWTDAYNKASEDGMSSDQLDAFGDFINNEDDVEGYPTPSVGFITGPMATKADKYPFLTKAEVDEYIQKVDELWQEVLTKSAVEGADMTSLLINADFKTKDLTGWTGSNLSVGGLEEFPSVERYGGPLAISQTVKNAPAGIYSIKVYAFYRPAANGDYDGTEEVPVYLYMNKMRTPVQHIMGDALAVEDAVDQVNCYKTQTTKPWFCTGAEGGYSLYDYETSAGLVPNGMCGASVAFSAGRYEQTVYGMVDDGEDMTIGLTSDGNSIHWCLFSNFKLTFEGKNIDAVNSVLDVKLEELRDLLDNEENIITKACRDASEAVYKKAYEADYEKETLWSALNSVLDAINDVQANKKAMDELTPAIDDMENAALDLSEVDGGSDTEAYTKYADVVCPKVVEDEVNKLDTEEVTALVEEVKAMTEELKVAQKVLQDASIKEEIAGATDADPKDATALITNPSYENGNDEGWTYEGDAPKRENRADMCEYWKVSFDYHQTLYALIPGTYEVAVNCFNRYQDAIQSDLDALEEGKKNEVQTAFVYVTTADKSYSEPFRLASEGARESWDLTGESTNATSKANEGTTLYFPNNMQAAGAAFEELDEETGSPIGDEKNYVVRVVFTLTEQGDVTIGVKNPEATGWSIWDNWTLTYFGTESSKTDSADPVGINAIDAQPAVLKNRKVFENGRIVIYKNGQKYNVAGQAIK